MGKKYEQFFSSLEIFRNYGVRMYEIQRTIENALSGGFDYEELLNALSNSGYIAGLLLTGPLVTAANTLLGAIGFFNSMAPSEQSTILASCSEGRRRIGYVMSDVFAEPRTEAVRVDTSFLVLENNDGSFVKIVSSMGSPKEVMQGRHWISR